MLISQNQDEIKSALSLQRNCELETVWLERSDLWRERSDVEFEQPFSLKFSHASAARVDQKGRLTVEVEFRFDSTDSATPPRKAFSLGCVYELTYTLNPGYSPSESEITAFGNGNAIFNCWPYAREFAQNIALRTGHTPPPLPLLRIVPQVRKATEGEADQKPNATKISVPAQPRHRIRPRRPVAAPAESPKKPVT